MDAIDAPGSLAVLSGAAETNEDAFQRLVEDHSARVFRLAFRITGNEQDAEDIVQESFLRAYRQLRRFEGRSHVGTWLYRIVVNCSLDLIRTRRSAPPIQWVADERGDYAGAAPDPERLAQSGEIQRRIHAAMQQLTPLERAAFTLRHDDGRSIREIGRTLNLGTSAAKHAVFRAVRKLRTALRPLTCTSANKN